MLQWLRNRLGRTEPERIPETQGPTQAVCRGTRRGRTQRPVRLVRMQRRAQNKRARASRKRNRV